jgi:F-box protein 9
MTDDSELQRFREQWKKEVWERSLGQSPSSSAIYPAEEVPSHTYPRPRPPSFSQTRVTSTRAVEDNGYFDEEPQDLSVPQPQPSAARRVSMSMTGIPGSALEHYERAVEKETEGSLGESLKLYRKAFRMDERVDKAYKEKYYPRLPVPQQEPAVKGKGKAVAAPPPVGGVTAHHFSKAALVPPGLSELVANFAGLAIEPTTKPLLTPAGEGTAEDEERAGENKFSLLAAVPSEILLQILYSLASIDVASYVRLSQVCKSLAYLVATEDSIWRGVCVATYRMQIWDWKCAVTGHPLIDEVLFPKPQALGGDGLDDEVEDEKRHVPVNEVEVLRYNNSWQEMFRQRPRLRYNGIYISTCNYHRPGGHSSGSITWNTPVHIVTYYRYLRFYPDGTLLSLLTTHEPSDVVYHFSKLSLTPAHLGGLPAGSSALSSWGGNVGHGRWRIDRDGQIDIETQVPGMLRYLFRMQLRVRSVKGSRTTRGGVKLVWEGFWSWNKLTDDLALFEGRNDKPFFFSRVAAVEKELGII